MHNITQWQLAQRLRCDRAAAFDGLCPFSATTAGPAQRRWYLQPKMQLGQVSRWALLTYSDRAWAKLTRPSLQDFAAMHPEYDLMFEEEALLDSRDFHPAWNKLAYARRALILGKYDAVVCFDDDIFIVDPVQDPIGKAIREHFPSKLVIASLDEHVSARVPFNTGVLILKSSPETLMMLDEIFRIGRQLRLVNGYSWLPRLTGLWDQDAFADYISLKGNESFALLPHGQLQTLVRSGRPLPSQELVFAAHFTGLLDLEPHEVHFVRDAILQFQSRDGAAENGGHPPSLTTSHQCSRMATLQLVSPHPCESASSVLFHDFQAEVHPPWDRRVPSVASLPQDFVQFVADQQRYSDDA
eukprot:Skav229196  [mRNA]  locus=scaffold1004:490268:491335:- [translate_table: standard]